MAAVSDFKVDRTFKGKLSSDQSINLKLIPQTKIVNQIKKLSPKTKLIAFKAEYGLEEKELIEKALKKLKESRADIIIANDISQDDRGFESDNNEVYIIYPSKKFIKITLTSKRKVAEKIIDYLFVIPSKEGIQSIITL